MPTTVQVPLCALLLLHFLPAAHPSFNRFLVEGPRGTILHTGDLRAEPWFLTSLSRNPVLQPYIPDTEENLRVLIARGDLQGSLTKTLNAIYLDTACLLRASVVPTKVMILNVIRTNYSRCECQESAVKGLVELIALFDSDTYFFLNTWTWGYEDVLKGITRAFQCQVGERLLTRLIPTLGACLQIYAILVLICCLPPSDIICYMQLASESDTRKFRFISAIIV